MRRRLYWKVQNSLSAATEVVVAYVVILSEAKNLSGNRYEEGFFVVRLRRTSQNDTNLILASLPK